MKKTWRNLRVGDRIRYVRVPAAELESPHGETRRLIEILIKRGRPLRIYERKHGMAWIYRRVRDEDGIIVHHHLAIGPADAGCWVMVKNRVEP